MHTRCHTVSHIKCSRQTNITGNGQADTHWAHGFSDDKQWAGRQRAGGFSDDKRWAGRLWAGGSGYRRWAGRQWAEGFSGYRQWAGRQWAKMVSIIDVYEMNTRTCDLSRYGTRERHFYPSDRQAVSLAQAAWARCGSKPCVSRQVEGPLQLVSTRKAYRTALAVFRGI